MRREFVEKIYAGWLGKIIGIRLGAPIEGWTYEKIKNIYGETDGYLVDYREFAADDDSNGPLFLIRALEDSKAGKELKAEDVGRALLNYAPFEHGFFWWGGYGTATEHTAYLNLRNGIEAPRSGSIAQNGSTMAEQIGGQIFIDTWGLAAPGNPDLAAKLAREAASVTHDGNGIYGGIFVAVCISLAFVENDMRTILEKGLSYIPKDCEYAKTVRAVMGFYEENKGSGWRSCRRYIAENFGYDRYPGNCHIIPNAAVMILSLLYGEGDFSHTLNICNMCGWDTDCNVGNVGTIMGVFCGLDKIDYDKWRKPIGDFLACSSVIGDLNITDVPTGALYVARQAALLEGEELPGIWKEIAQRPEGVCHFEFPGSTHGMRIRVERLDERDAEDRRYFMENTDEVSYFGERCLKFSAGPVMDGENVRIYKKTYYVPEDFYDSRYDPAFSPTAYPGQRIHGCVYLPDYGRGTLACLYARDARTGDVFQGDKIRLEKGKWKELDYQIPAVPGGLIDEVGFCFSAEYDRKSAADLVCMADDFYICGPADYSIDFSREKEESWTVLHKEISQFTRLKGLSYLEGGRFHLSCSDFGEVYTGGHNWENYEAEFTLVPELGDYHWVNVRVQGAVRSYAVGLLPENQAAILKNDNGYRVLAKIHYAWKAGEEYRIRVRAAGNTIEAFLNEEAGIKAVDEEAPYLMGSIGMSVREGSHTSYRCIQIRPCEK